MTPEPDPPVPAGRTYKMYFSDTFSNAHMIRVFAGDAEVTGTTNANELINGTRIDNATPVELTINAPETGDYILSFGVKSYDNTKPSYADPYYDGSNSVRINGQAGVYKWNIGTYADGTAFNWSLTNSAGCTIAERS